MIQVLIKNIPFENVFYHLEVKYDYMNISTQSGNITEVWHKENVYGQSFFIH